MRRPFFILPRLARVGTDVDNKKAKSEFTEEQKMRPPESQRDQRPNRRKEKLICLDDLIRKTRYIEGGHQLLFGAADTTETTNKEN
jgi:hypothetical protein